MRVQAKRKSGFIRHAKLLMCATVYASQAFSAPDFTSRNFLEVDNYQGPQASSTATDGVWAAAGGTAGFINGGSFTVEEPIVVTGPWDGSGAHQHLVYPPSPNLAEAFGASVDLHGNRLTVGTPAELDSILSCSDEYGCSIVGFEPVGAGKVHIYEYNGDTFAHQRTIANGVDNDRFGLAHNLLADRLLVGAPGAVPAQAFLYNPDNGNLIATFTSSDLNGLDSYGLSVAQTETLALVGAPDAEQVYVYRRDGTGNWNTAGKLVNPDTGGRFGVSLAAHGSYIIVGAPDINRAYLFEDTGNDEWPVTKTLSWLPGGDFGHAVAIRDTTVWVSAPRQVLGSQRRGSVLQFQQNDVGDWPLTKNIQSFLPADLDQFGTALDVSSEALSILSYRIGGVFPVYRSTQDLFTSTDNILDSDNDAVSDFTDNCPSTPNPDQADFDFDGRGDVCDDDIDADSLSNDDEALAGSDPYNPDTDGDGLLDGVDPFPTADDGDGDGFGEARDNCPLIANPDQSNIDGDQFGDACDPDIDNDLVPNDEEIANGTDPFNPDTDGDGIDDLNDEFPTDSENGWVQVTRFDLPGLEFQLAVGDGIVLVAPTSLELVAYARSGSTWLPTAIPPVVLPASGLVTGLYFWGDTAGITIADDDSGSRKHRLHLFEWSNTEGWTESLALQLTGPPSHVELLDDRLVMTLRKAVGSRLEFYQLGGMTATTVAVQSLEYRASDLLLLEDYVFVGNGTPQTDNEVVIFNADGTKHQTIQELAFGFGKLLFETFDGRVLAGSSGMNHYFLDKSPISDVWSLSTEGASFTFTHLGDQGRVAIKPSSRTLDLSLEVRDFKTDNALGTIQVGRAIRHMFDSTGETVVAASRNLLIITEIDLDGDGVVDHADNCRETSNSSQLDSDGDGAGDACDVPVPGC